MYFVYVGKVWKSWINIHNYRVHSAGTHFKNGSYCVPVYLVVVLCQGVTLAARTSILWDTVKRLS